MQIKFIRISLLLSLILGLNQQVFFAQNQNRDLINKLAGTYVSDDTDCKISLSLDSKGNYLVMLNDKYRDLGKINISLVDNEVYVNFAGVEAKYENEQIIFQNYGNEMNYYLHFAECDKFVQLNKNTQQTNNIDLSHFFKCAENSKYLTFPITENQFKCFYEEIDGDSRLKPKYQKQTKPFTQKEIKIQNLGYWSHGFLEANTRYLEVGKFKLNDITYKIIMYRAYGISDADLLNTQINSYDAKGNLIDVLLLDSRYYYEDHYSFTKFSVNQDIIYIDKYFVRTAEEDLEIGGIGDMIPEDKQFAEIEQKSEYQIVNGKFDRTYFYDAETERRENAEILD